MTVTFTVPGEPHGKERHRTTKSGHIYTPKITKAYEAKIRACYILQGGRSFGGVPIRLKICAYFPIPKRATKAERAKMKSGEIRPTKKPDGDNIEKSVADALNGVAFDDDRQIISAKWEKFYAPDERSEGYLIVTVEG